MEKINYHYTNLPKQVLFLSAMLYVLMMAVVMGEIFIFKLEGYYEETNFLLTSLLYVFYIAILVCLLRQHKFFYGEYNGDVLIYHNKLLRKEKKFNLSDAKLAVFDTFGIKFYADTNINPNMDKPIFFFPFFRGGIIEAISINNFYKFLLEKGDIQVIKNFQVLPGYTKKWRLISVFYAFAAVIVFMSCSTPLATIIILFQNH